MLLTEIPPAQGPMVFAADLIPVAAWAHAPITMGYDRFPELLIEEKQRLPTYLLQAGGALFFTHDPQVSCGHVMQDDCPKRFGVRPDATLLANCAARLLQRDKSVN